jgi:CheY-like chemotaxis protein
MEKRVLVVEDDTSLMPALARMIESINPEASVEWVTNAEEALHLLRKGLKFGRSHVFDLILSDIVLDGEHSGIDLMEACRQAELKSKVILTSGQRVPDATLPFLMKPISATALERLAGDALSPDRGTKPWGDSKWLENLIFALSGWIFFWAAVAPIHWALHQIITPTTSMTIASVAPVPVPTAPPVRRALDPDVIPGPLRRDPSLQPKPRWHGMDPGRAFTSEP